MSSNKIIKDWYKQGKLDTVVFTNWDEGDDGGTSSLGFKSNKPIKVLSDYLGYFSR